MSLAGKTALVTGASSGIGRAVALELARHGAALALLGRDEARLAEVAALARAAGGTAATRRLELTDDAALEELADLAPDLLIHSAGVVQLGSVLEGRVADFDEQYRVNVRAPYRLTQLLLPALLERRGQVVFVNSGAGLSANANWGQYAATKHALKALADSLRAEVGPQGVRVLSVFPGRTDSPMQRRVREQEAGDYDPERYLDPQDVARQLVAALSLSPRSAVTDLVVRPAG